MVTFTMTAKTQTMHTKGNTVAILFSHYALAVMEKGSREPIIPK